MSVMNSDSAFVYGRHGNCVGLCIGRRRICRHNNGNNGARGAPGIIRE